MENIVIVAHKYLPQPDDDLVLYNNKLKKQNILHIYHSFNETPDRRSSAIWYKKGLVYKKYNSRDYKNYPEAFIYVKELLFTVIVIMKLKVCWDMYIGMDGLCASFGIFLKKFKKIKKVIYWAIDFVPTGRFKYRFKNDIYKAINKYSYLSSDEMWDLSPRMSEARRIYFKLKKDGVKRIKVVPYGMWLNRIKRYSYKNCQKDSLVFMGHLIEKQGVQLIIKAIPYIVKELSGFKFKIIGEGEYKKELIKLAEDLKVAKYCKFIGKINDNIIMEKEIAKSCVAVAPYIKKLDKWTLYADPGKVKTYLACGVPVLLTDVPWNAKQIEKAGCGKIINENEKDIAENVIIFLNPLFNQKSRISAVSYSKSFDWENIFSNIIK